MLNYINIARRNLNFGMKSSIIQLTMLVVLSVVYNYTSAQEIDKPLADFDKVKVSSHIRVVLTKGEQENLRLEYSGVTAEELNYKVEGSTLKIYLTGAELVDKYVTIRNGDQNHKESYYKNAKVTAYITYKELKSLELRGGEGAVCESPLSAKKFTLKLYGENEVNLADLHTKKLRGSFYGENRLKINSGSAVRQKFNLFGENYIQTQSLSSETINVTYFGASKMALMADDKIFVKGIGELDLAYSGNTSFKRWAIGSSIINGQANERASKKLVTVHSMEF
jgi:hypothetical protein